MTQKIRLWVLLPLLTLYTSALQGQTVTEELLAQPERAGGIAYALPTNIPYKDTPAPDGKKPFYLSHFGSSAAYYREDRKDYEMPLNILIKADSMNMLTPLGKDVLRRFNLINQDAAHRSGELTFRGAQQMRELAQELVDRFPQLFDDGSFIDARSIVRNHNIMTMQEAMTQIARHGTQMDLRIESSHSNDPWMYVRDKELEADRFNDETEACYLQFRAANSNPQRLMESLFVSPDYVKQNIDPVKFSEQIFLVANTVQHIALKDKMTLYDIFTPQELYQHWRIRNAWNYIRYGCFELNGGNQPYSQRAPLWNLLHMGDSIKALDFPVVHLRYSSRGMLISMICLMELNGYGLKTANLNQLDSLGWVDYRMGPFGSNLQVIHYRKDKNDDDILIKVLLNGQEMRLPITTDCAPYYHWQDVKRYYLRKLYAHERQRYDDKQKKKGQNEEQ